MEGCKELESLRTKTGSGLGADFAAKNIEKNTSLSEIF